MKLITDPRVFNFIIMSLYLLNAGRWGLEGKWGVMCYWLSALGITASVTWGFKY